MADDDLPPPRRPRGRTGAHRSGASGVSRGIARVTAPLQPKRSRSDRPAPEAQDHEAPTEPLVLGAEPDEHSWLDQEAGPVVRPYTLTGGRSQPVTSGLHLLTHVETLYAPEADLVGLQPEHREILDLARTATSVAEIAARLDLPLGVVRILVGDLLQASLVSTFEANAAVRAPDDDILLAVIDGLRAL